MKINPIAVILIIVSIVAIVGLICDSIEDSSHERTKQLSSQVKLEQIKQFGTTNALESVINKK